MNRIELPQELKARAFDLMSSLGMTIENRKFHASAQIGHPHSGYCRYAKEASDKWALYMAVIQCADSYYLKNADEREVLNTTTEPLHNAYIECANLAGKVAELQDKLNAIYEQKPFRLFVADSRIGSEDMYPGDAKLEHEHGVTVIPMYVLQRTSPLHKIHRAYGVEHVDTGVNDHD